MRKMLSYRVEGNFYRDWAKELSDEEEGNCIPKLVASSDAGAEEQVLIMEDLSIRYPIFAERRGTLSEKQTRKALSWLASFHSSSWDAGSKSIDFCPPPSSSSTWSGEGLWAQGGYHYLSTRRSELSSINPRSHWGRLGLHSSSPLPFAVDYCLSHPPDPTHLSLIHGDVKAANMAFSEDGSRMAMYDFQYVGLGLGVQDLAKFLTTSIPDFMLQDREGEEKLLRVYLGELNKRLEKKGKGERYEWEDLMRDWELALVSWVRFLAGWSGGFWGNTEWLQARVEALLLDEKWVQAVLERYEARPQQT